MELFSQDVGKDCAWEVGGVVLPLPRRQVQPEERQEHFPRAQGKALSPLGLLLTQ